MAAVGEQLIFRLGDLGDSCQIVGGILLQIGQQIDNNIVINRTICPGAVVVGHAVNEIRQCPCCTLKIELFGISIRCGSDKVDMYVGLFLHVLDVDRLIQIVIHIGQSGSNLRQHCERLLVIAELMQALVHCGFLRLLY